MSALDRILSELQPILPKVPPQSGPTSASEIRRKLVDGATWLFAPEEEIPAIWGAEDDVLWAQGEPLYLAGGSGVGKTTIGSQLIAGRMGLRGEVLGYPIEASPGRVLYLASDRPRQAKKVFRRLIAESSTDIVRERLRVWTGPPEADLAEQVALLLQMCEAAEATTVVLDSLKDMFIGVSEDIPAARFNRAIQLVVASGVEVLGLHHLTKAGQEATPSLQSIYGSTWIVNGAGSVLLLSGSPGADVVTLHHLKQPMSVVGPLTVEHDHNSGVSRVVGSIDPVGVVEASAGGLSAREVAEVVFQTDAPSESQIKRVRAKLRAAAEGGRLVSEAGSAGGAGGSRAATFRSVVVPVEPPDLDVGPGHDD